jgi:two-component system, OmpR family, sensor histidine kinase KdpD
VTRGSHSGDELKDLERELEAEREQAAELRALDETKNTFLAAVSHDLRTPLAAILGLAVTLQRQALELEQVKELAGRIATNALKLDRMVTDLLDLDRISRGMVAPELRSLNLGRRWPVWSASPSSWRDGSSRSRSRT